MRKGGTWYFKLGNKVVRCIWNKEKSEWYYSAVDLIGVWIKTQNPARYWSDFRRRTLRKATQKIPKEFYAKCVVLHLISSSGQKRVTDTIPGAEILTLWELLGCPVFDLDGIDVRVWASSEKYRAKRPLPHRHNLKRVV